MNDKKTKERGEKNMKMVACLIAIIAIVAVVMFAGCTEKEASPILTQIKIVDVDASSAGLSQIRVDVTIENVGGVTAKNVIASVILLLDDGNLDEHLNDPALLRYMAVEGEKGVLCLDREYLGDIKSGQYAKANLLIRSDDIPEDTPAHKWHTAKVATADNAEAVYY